MRASLIVPMIGFVSAFACATPRRVSACGGCFHPTDLSQNEATVVTGHRMVLSVSPQQTTLWDQIEYAGDPTEFAWVLPTAGVVEVGLSSDLLFEVLEAETQVTVRSPNVSCPSQPRCDNFSVSASASSKASSSGSGIGGGVTVVAQETVGPYETVQLAATDPNALVNWLTSHGYAIPAEVEPIVSAYVNEGFGFLAMRLIPGQGVDAMRPVRVTTPGASPSLPLRMVSAGTGARTAITLFIVGEGRYEPQNFNFETITAPEVVWNWGTQSSNYAELRQEILDADAGSRWLMEAAEPKLPSAFNLVKNRAESSPATSGYTPDDAFVEANADIATLLAGISTSSLWVTRLAAELSREALTVDLRLEASPDQYAVDRDMTATKTIGQAPRCPPVQQCDDGSAGGSPSDDGCAVTAGTDRSGAFATLALAGLAALVAAARRRRTGPRSVRR